MTISKRGDHLFAAGLLKTIRDVGDMIRTEIGDTSEGRVLHTELAAWRRALAGDAFEMTINRGRAVTGADPHSVAFGRAVREFDLTMRSLVSALQHRRDIDTIRDQAERNDAVMQAARLLTDAKRYAEVAVNRMFEAVIDPAVLRQILGGSRRDRVQLGGNIDNARSALNTVRGNIVGSIGKM